MNDKTYTVTLADGTVLAGLRLNGNNFISGTAVDAAVFTGNCSPVVISDGAAEKVYQNMELVQIVETGGEYWFVLRELTEKELADIKTRADIEYLAMMTNVEL